MLKFCSEKHYGHGKEWPLAKGGQRHVKNDRKHICLTLIFFLSSVFKILSFQTATDRAASLYIVGKKVRGQPAALNNEVSD